MIRVYREAYTRTPPAEADRIAKGGKTVVRWKARGGKWIEGELMPSGKVRVEVTDAWYYSFTGPDGRPVRGRKGLADKVATEALARRLQLASDRERAGLDLPAAVAGAAKSLPGHLADYLEHLRAKGRADHHVKEVAHRVGYVLRATRVQRAEELTESTVAVAVARLRTDPGTDSKGRPRKPIGSSTVNGYMGAVKAFTTWLKRNGKAASNPLADLVRETDRRDVRRRRRRLTDPEFNAVLTAVLASPVKPHIGRPLIAPKGEARACLYLTAAYTGLRAQELAGLLPTAFYLDARAPHVAVWSVKRKCEDLIPLPAALVPRLRTFLVARPAREPVWPGNWWKRAAVMLARDLAAAEPPIEFRDARGRYADFHSLRRTYIAKLGDAGVDPKTAQKLARHSTITLTLDVYRDEADLHETAAAVTDLAVPPALFSTLSPTCQETPTDGVAGGQGATSERPAGK